MLVNEKTSQVKQQILDWLKEEACSPQEQPDPNAYFNFLLRTGNIGSHIIQSVQKIDSFICITRLVVPPEQIALQKGMGLEGRREFLWEIKMNILNNDELLDFNIETDNDEIMTAFTISSKPVFYGNLTKTTLFSAVYAVNRGSLMVMFTLQKDAGINPSKKDTKLPYST